MQRVFERDQSSTLPKNLAVLSAIVADRDRSRKKLDLAERLAETWVAALKRHDVGKQLPKWSSGRFDRHAAMVTMVMLCLDGKY